MLYLESLDELDVLLVTGLIEVCKENRDFIFGYALYSRKDFYKNIEELLNKNIKIKIPVLDERHFKTIGLKL